MARRNVGDEILEGLKEIKAGQGKRKTVKLPVTGSAEMDEKLFEELTTSIREAGAIRRGKKAASRTTER